MVETNGRIGASSGGAAAVLERPVRRDRDFGPELDVLRVASAAHLAGLLPRMRFDLREMPTVVVDVVEGRPASDHRVGGVLDPEVAAAIGAAIGAWHVGARAHAGRFRVAPDTPPRGLVARDPLLGAALASLAAEWRPVTVVHGDCRVAHASVTRGPSGCGDATVVLTRWGRSGRGDPAWDAGCLVADLLATAHADGRAAAAEASVSAALAAYGRTTAARDDASTARRVMLCTIARLAGAGLQAGDAEVLALARSMAAWSSTWTERFERWLA